MLGKNTKIAYFDQHRAQLEDDKSIFDNVADNNSRISLGGELLEVRSYLERFLFDPHKQRQPVGSLSGGERARVALAKILSRGANLIILDEPTNDLDVATLSALEQMLVDFNGCAITVTHDRYFLNRVATSILAFQGDGEVVRYAGNFDDYRSQRSRSDDARAAREIERLAPAKAKAKETARTKLSFAEQKELDGLPALIEAGDKAVVAAESKLADPALYTTRGSDIPGLTAELTRAKAEAARLLARWEALEMKREAAGKG